LPAAPPPSREARAEVDRLTKELATARRLLEEAEQALRRLDAVTNAEIVILRELEEVRNADATELGDWLAAGAKGKRPEGSIGRVQRRHVELAEDFRAARSVSDKYRLAVREASMHVELLAHERDAAEARLATDPVYFIDAGPTLGRLKTEEVTPPAPPVNVDTPALLVEGLLTATATVGQTLSITNGNWTGEPIGYQYLWHRDGTYLEAAVGSTYTVNIGDPGSEITCVVEASNAAGSTTAPPSNAVSVPAARSGGTRRG
jgi:hypothetical protein